MAIQPLSIKITTDLGAFTSGINQALDQLRGVGERVRQSVAVPTQQAGLSLGQMGTAITGVVAKMGLLGAAYASLRSVQTFAEMADQAAMASARIQGLTGDLSATRDAQSALFEMSQRLQAPLSDALSSFSRMLPAVQDLGGGVRETTRLTEIMMTTAKLSGASAAEAGASAMQFAQALSSGVLQGDELRSIMENNTTLTRLLADGLGVSIGQLRKMGEEGKLTADLVANVLLGQYSDIQAKAAELPGTVGGAWTQIRNAFTQFVTTITTNLGVFTDLAGLMTEVARAITSVSTAAQGADKDVTKLGQNRGALTWAQTFGVSFAYLADVVGAAVSAIWNNLKGLGGMLEVVSRQLTALGYALVGNFTMAKAALDDAGAAADRMAANFRRSRDAAVEMWNSATGGGGKAVGAYIDSMLGAPVQVNEGDGNTLKNKPTADPDAEKKATQAAIREMNAYSDALDAQIRKLREKSAINASLLQVEIDGIRSAALARIDSDEQTARAQLATKQITQAQFLELEAKFEEQRYDIRRAATERMLELAKAEGRDPAELARLNEQLLDLERQYQLRKQGIALEVQQAAAGGQGGMNIFKSMQTSMGQALDAMLTRAKTFGQAMAGVWDSLRGAVTRNIAGMLQQMVLASVKERSLALGKIGQDAAKAASGAYSALVGIPYVGPFIAPPAAAAAFAAVMAFGGGMKSASQGYDIPAGLNPVTQLHAEEMVLPADIARPLRDSLSGGGQGGREITVNVQGSSPGDWFLMHKSELARALRVAHREFAFT